MKILSKSPKLLSKRTALDTLKTTKTNFENIETIKYKTKKYCKDSKEKERIEFIHERLREKGLFDFEIFQLVDNWPKNLLCFQLIIEEMEERFGEDELKEMLALFD